MKLGESIILLHRSQQLPLLPAAEMALSSQASWAGSRRDWRHAGLHFPEFQGIAAQAHLENYGVSLLRKNWQVIAVLTQPFLLSSLSRSLNSSSSASVCVSLQAGLMAVPLRFDGRVVLVTGAGGGEYAKARGPASSSSLSCWESPFFGLESARSRSCDLSIWAVGSGGGAAWGASDWTRWG